VRPLADGLEPLEHLDRVGPVLLRRVGAVRGRLAGPELVLGGLQGSLFSLIISGFRGPIL
jgi:hypothetical protein